MKTSPADHRDRDLAATELDKNVIVLAGAGTGKTRLLIDRLTLLILGRGVPVDEIVALTFTKKAAEEMRERLENRLREVAADPACFQLLIDEYPEKKEEWPDLAAKALDDIPKAQIGTIHSFAAHLLRLYPLQGGVDPKFKEDEGTMFDDLFEREWSGWIREELGAESRRAAFWRALLEEVSLDDLRDLAVELCSPGIDPSALRRGIDVRGLGKKCSDELDALRGARAVSNQAKKFNEGLETLKIIFAGSMQGNPAEPEDLEFINDWNVEVPKGWAETEAERDALNRRIKDLKNLAKALAHVDDDLMVAAVDAVDPFVRRFQRVLSKRGVVSFDGLLVFARDLLRDHPDVRAQLKKQYIAFLVDEFQDTDPLQGEILFYLAETPAAHALDWKNVTLEPGRLFVVGDPKQSIYRFRGADVAAFEAFQRRMIEQGALETTLSVNFRSGTNVIASVNALFSNVMNESPGLQPAYSPLIAGRDKADGAGLEMKVVVPKTGAKADEVREVEAAAIAELIAAEAAKGTLAYENVAILLRSANAFTPYLEAFKNRGIPYLADGEKYFYQTAEVTEFLNLLSAVADPRDRLALVGILRTSVGALSDGEIFDLHRADALDYRRPPGILKEKISGLYSLLRELHASSQVKPVGVVLHEILERTWFMDLMATAGYGEQAVANLLKVARLADKWSAHEPLTMKSFVRRFRRYREDEREEGENPLADVQYPAVKVMTIHKAKGLEFPFVVLPNLSAEKRGVNGDADVLVRTWGASSIGLRLKRHGATNGAMVVLEDEIRRRDEAEEIRIFYVAATRAKDRMLYVLRSDAPKNSRFSEILRAGGVWPGVYAAPTENIQWPAEEESGDGARADILAADWKPARVGEEILRRREAFHRLANARLIVSPTFVQEEPEKGLDAERLPVARADAIQLGLVCHKVLEKWDFSKPVKARVKPAVEQAGKHFDLIPGEPASERMLNQAEDLLSAYFASDDYKKLSQCKILGREIPFLYALPATHESDPVLMRGVIDVLYERNGQWIVGDYKTTQLAGRSLEDAAAHYAVQGRAYMRAVAGALGKKVEFEVIFLREGRSVAIG